MDDVRALLAQAGLNLLDGSFAIVGLPLEEMSSLVHNTRSLTGVFALTVDQWEITLVINEKAWEAMASSFQQARVQHGYRVVTLDVVLEWSVVGFLAAVCGALAQRRIPVGVVSAYSRDHLLVRQEHLPKALETIRALMRKADEADRAT